MVMIHFKNPPGVAALGLKLVLNRVQQQADLDSLVSDLHTTCCLTRCGFAHKNRSESHMVIRNKEPIRFASRKVAGRFALLNR
jgi:hypothetical protein